MASVHIIPILPVRDMAEARAFWERVGVEVEAYDDGYAFVVVAGHEVAHLALHEDLDPASNHTGCYVHVGDANAWHERLATAGVEVSPVRDEPWRMTEFRFTDPSGNLVRVGHNS